MMIKAIAISILSLLVLSHATIAGDFHEGKGYGTVKLNMSSWSSKKIYDNDGEKKDRFDQRHFLVNLKGQYGISKHFNFLAEIPYLNNTIKADGKSDSKAALGDLQLGFRYAFTIQQPYAISISFLQSLATSDHQKGEYERNTGYGDSYQSINMDFEYKKNDKFYAVISGGGQLHHQGFGDAITGKIEAGIQLEKELWISLSFGGFQPLENGDESHFNQLGSYSNNSGLIAFEPEVSWKHKSGFGIFTAYQIPLKGQWIEATNTVKFGLFYKIQPKTD
ncbi:hypothetical protein BH11BAC2_BH11BAC2_11280 [soil metagenome]